MLVLIAPTLTVLHWHIVSPPPCAKDLRRNLPIFLPIRILQIYPLMPLDIHRQRMILKLILARPLRQMHMYNALA